MTAARETRSRVKPRSPGRHSSTKPDQGPAENSTPHRTQLGPGYAAGPALSMASSIQAKSASVAENSQIEGDDSALEEESQAQVQTALVLGSPDDALEREADSVADNVVNGNPAGSITPINNTGGLAQRYEEATAAPGKEEEPEAETTVQRQEEEPAEDAQEEEPVQRMCSECAEGLEEGAIQTKTNLPTIPDATEAPNEETPEPGSEAGEQEEQPETEAGSGDAAKEKAKVAEPALKPYQPDEIELPVQKKNESAAGRQSANGNASLGLSQKLSASKGGGDPLNAPERAEMEQHIGRDLSDVRIHNDSSSAGMNRDLNSRAFTHNNDIYFNSGEYKPELK